MRPMLPALLAAVVAAIALVPSTPIHASPAPCAGGAIALRFDDGPYPETNAILDQLAEYHMKATFFVVGEQVQQYPAIVQRIIQEGHQIANHTWSHPALADLTPAQVAQELRSTQDLVRQLTGFTPTLAGPPYGSTSDMVRAQMANLGLREVLKSRDSGDWDGADVEQIVGGLQLVPPGGIYLMHDWVPDINTVVSGIDWYFNDFWQTSPICAGRILPATTVNPVLDWQGQYYFATAVPW